MTMPANKRERTLLVVFVAALLAAGTLLGWKWLSQNLQARGEVLAQKQAQLQEARQWIAQKDQWLARMNWIASKPPPLYEGERTDAAFVQEVQSSLAQHGIEIVDQRIQETKSADDLIEAGVDLTLNSSLENLVHWLHDIQSVGAYRAVDHIRLKSDASNSQIRTEISLTQLYAHSGTSKTATR